MIVNCAPPKVGYLFSKASPEATRASYQRRRRRRRQRAGSQIQPHEQTHAQQLAKFRFSSLHTRASDASSGAVEGGAVAVAASCAERARADCVHADAWLSPGERVSYLPVAAVGRWLAAGGWRLPQAERRARAGARMQILQRPEKRQPQAHVFSRRASRRRRSLKGWKVWKVWKIYKSLNGCPIRRQRTVRWLKLISKLVVRATSARLSFAHTHPFRPRRPARLCMRAADQTGARTGRRPSSRFDSSNIVAGRLSAGAERNMAAARSALLGSISAQLSRRRRSRVGQRRRGETKEDDRPETKAAPS